MNKLRRTLVILMMLTAWHGNSQIGIRRDSVIISKEVARKVLIDLADYDRLRENNVELNLNECIALLREKDTVISYISQQNKLYKDNFLLYDKQLNIREKELVDAAKTKRKSNILFAAAGIAAGLILGLIIH